MIITALAGKHDAARPHARRRDYIYRPLLPLIFRFDYGAEQLASHAHSRYRRTITSLQDFVLDGLRSTARHISQGAVLYISDSAA